MARQQRKATALEQRTRTTQEKRILPENEREREHNAIGANAAKVLKFWLNLKDQPGAKAQEKDRMKQGISITTREKGYGIRKATAEHLISAALVSHGITEKKAGREHGPKGQILTELARLEQDHGKIAEEVKNEKNQEMFKMLLSLAQDDETRKAIEKQYRDFEKQIAKPRENVGKTHVLVRLISAAKANAELDYLARNGGTGKETGDRRKKIAHEILNFHAPFLKSAGLYAFGSNLEDEAFKITHPEQYEKIEKEVRELNSRIESIKKNVRRDLKAFLEGKGLKNVQIEIRKKSIASIYRKMTEEGGELKYPNVKNIHDLIGIRVLFDREKGGDEKAEESETELQKKERQKLVFKRDSEACNNVFEMLKRLPGSFLGSFNIIAVSQKEGGDYDVNPKANGYRSRHSILYGKDEEIEDINSMEVQAHTKEMHRANERGEAAHKLYKGLKILSEPEMHLCFMPVPKGVSYDAFRKAPRQ